MLGGKPTSALAHNLHAESISKRKRSSFSPSQGRTSVTVSIWGVISALLYFLRVESIPQQCQPAILRSWCRATFCASEGIWNLLNDLRQAMVEVHLRSMTHALKPEPTSLTQVTNWPARSWQLLQAHWCASSQSVTARGSLVCLG